MKEAKKPKKTLDMNLSTVIILIGFVLGLVNLKIGFVVMAIGLFIQILEILWEAEQTPHSDAEDDLP